MRFLTKIVCAISLLWCCAVPARSETMTWLVQKNVPSNAQIAFFSQTGAGRRWPAGGAYDLQSSQINTITLACEPHEKICYGAWVEGNSSASWGAGLDGRGGCPNCCGTCGAEKTVRLDGPANPTIGSKAVTAFKWVYNAQPSPGTRSWFLDGSSRWHERYPDGSEAKVFDRVNRGSANGCSGSVARASTEADFQVFIPDVGCNQMAALFRRGEGPWSNMGQMFDIR